MSPHGYHCLQCSATSVGMRAHATYMCLLATARASMNTGKLLRAFVTTSQMNVPNRTRVLMTILLASPNYAFPAGSTKPWQRATSVSVARITTRPRLQMSSINFHDQESPNFQGWKNICCRMGTLGVGNQIYTALFTESMNGKFVVVLADQWNHACTRAHGF